MRELCAIQNEFEVAYAGLVVLSLDTTGGPIGLPCRPWSSRYQLS
jgi:hypothetical protein